MAELDKVPVPDPKGVKTGVNQPDSPYGEVADLRRLRQQMGPPDGRGAAPQGGEDPGQVVPLPPQGDFGGGSSSEGPLPGLPRRIADPTNRPGVPVGSNAPADLDRGPSQLMGAVVDAKQKRLQIITALALSDNPTTREWARLVLELMVSKEG